MESQVFNWKVGSKKIRRFWCSWPFVIMHIKFKISGLSWWEKMFSLALSLWLYSCSGSSAFRNLNAFNCLLLLLWLLLSIYSHSQVAQQTIKKYIPISNITDCEAIGEVYFKAWRMALSEECRADVEFAIQDLMYNAVVAVREPIGEVVGGVNKVFWTV